MESATFDLYRDIAERTDGDVYLGVVGPRMSCRRAGRAEPS